MKAILIIYNMAIEDDVNEALQQLGVDCYTKFTKVLGKGELSQPHLDTAVWPIANNATFVVTDQAKATAITEKIRQMREKYASEGLKAFVWPIEDVT
jgi:nitrogen regulatory protein PII